MFRTQGEVEPAGVYRSKPQINQQLFLLVVRGDPEPVRSNPGGHHYCDDAQNPQAIILIADNSDGAR
jgi:hypothetical protein